MKKSVHHRFIICIRYTVPDYPDSLSLCNITLIINSNKYLLQVAAGIGISQVVASRIAMAAPGMC